MSEQIIYGPGGSFFRCPQHKSLYDPCPWCELDTARAEIKEIRNEVVKHHAYMNDDRPPADIVSEIIDNMEYARELADREKDRLLSP